MKKPSENKCKWRKLTDTGMEYEEQKEKMRNS